MCLLRIRATAFLVASVGVLACNPAGEVETWACTPGVDGAPEPHLPLPIPAGLDGELEVDIADPHVIRVGDRWYLYATSPGLDFRVRSRSMPVLHS